VNQPYTPRVARYELPDHATGKYWEITLEGNVVTTRTGTVGAYSSKMDGKTLYGSDRGRAGKRTYKDAQTAQRAYDKAVEGKRAEGYRRVDRPEDVVEAVVDVHRDAALEAMISAAVPGDTAPYLVYADWLQQRGDPRGELITLQHAMHQQRDTKTFMEFKQREQALRFAHERAWLGVVTVAAAHRLKLEWRLGFVESARVAASTYPSEPTLAAVLGALLASPAGCAVRSLDLTAPSDGRVDEILAAVAGLPVAGLRKLRCESRCGDRAAALAAFEPHRARVVAAGVTCDEHLY
jgi:uncharacterized protein (TIGR02996 family)